MMDADLGPQISAVSSAELNALSQISARATEKQAGVLSSSNEEVWLIIPTVCYCVLFYDQVEFTLENFMPRIIM